MKQEESLYKLSHYYTTDEEKYSIFIKSPMDTEEFIKVIGAICFKFEEVVDESMDIEETHLAQILESFYGMKDVTESSKWLLPYTTLERSEWEDVNRFEHDGLNIIHIDLYSARENCCGKGYKELMNTHLPKSEEFESFMNDLIPIYLNSR